MLEIKDVLTTLGIEGDPKEMDADKFREAVEKNFIPLETAHEHPEVVKKAVGRMAGSVTTRAKQLFGLSESEIKDKKLEDILEMGAGKYQSEIGGLKEQMKTGSEKKVADLLKQLEEKEKAVSDYKAASERIQTEFDQFKGSSENTLKSYKVNYLLKDARSKLPIADGVSEVTRRGFDAVINDKYQFDLENDELVIMSKDGHRIQSKRGKAGGLADVIEILETEASAANILKVNNVQKKPFTFTPQIPTGDSKRKPARDLRQRTI